MSLSLVCAYDIYSQAVSTLSGALILHNLSPTIPKECAGVVGPIHRKMLLNEGYIHIAPPVIHEGVDAAAEQGRQSCGIEGGASRFDMRERNVGLEGVAWIRSDLWQSRVGHVRTLVVAQRDRVSLEELTHVVEAAGGVMRRLEREGLHSGGQTLTAVAGGGCFEVHAAAYLRQRAQMARTGACCSNTPICVRLLQTAGIRCAISFFLSMHVSCVCQLCVAAVCVGAGFRLCV